MEAENPSNIIGMSLLQFDNICRFVDKKTALAPIPYPSKAMDIIR